MSGNIIRQIPLKSCFPWDVLMKMLEAIHATELMYTYF